MSTIILGAGLAGLAAGQRLQDRGIQADLYEKRNYLGGHAASHNISGFIFDEGPHISFTKNSKIKRLFAQAVQDSYFETDALVTNYWKNFWIRHPVQTNLFGLPIDTVVSCLLDYIKASNTDTGSIETYADWCYSSLGKTICEEFTFPYTRKYWTTTAHNMSTDWIGNRIYKPELEEVIHGALTSSKEKHHYITKFRYPQKGGFSAYVQSVIPNQTIHFDHELVQIDLKRKVLLFSNGNKHHYEHLISSIPIPELIYAIKDVPKNVISAAKNLTCTSLVLVSIGIERENNFPNAHWMYFYDEDIVFARAHLPHLLSSNNTPSGCGSIQVETYYSKYRSLPTTDVLNKSIEDLYQTGLLFKDDNIIVAEHKNIPYANILFDLERKKNLTIIQTYLHQHGIICCGRYGEWDYFWSDDSILSGWKAGEKRALRSLRKNISK